MLQQETEEDAMLRKALLSVTVALFSLSLLVYGVIAQGDDDIETPAVSVQPSVAAANVQQTVPITLTLTIPGPDGPLTVEVPVFLSLDIRIGISPDLTTTLQVTPSVVTEVEATPTATVEAITEDAGEDVDVTVENTDEEPTEEPTSTPTAPDPTETPGPDEAEATEVPLPTATPTATVAPEPVVVAPACPDPRAVITSPGNGQVISGTVEIMGSATHENFLYYKLEYAQGESIDPDATFVYLADARVQVTGGLLAAFDSTTFANGAYTLKLTVVDNSGNFPPPCTVSTVITN
jgi:hypothetical protein